MTEIQNSKQFEKPRLFGLVIGLWKFGIYSGFGAWNLLLVISLLIGGAHDLSGKTPGE
jgi:hypothetical protein